MICKWKLTNCLVLTENTRLKMKLAKKRDIDLFAGHFLFTRKEPRVVTDIYVHIHILYIILYI